MILPKYTADVVTEWIPALDGVEAKLEAGARVADVGGGLPLSHGFPNTRVDCYGRGQAGTFPGAFYDLVASFDCLREEEDPVAVARHVHDSLAGDGTWLVVDAGGPRISYAIRAGGFTSVRVVADTPLHLVLEARP
jgi:hypothetical protein